MICLFPILFCLKADGDLDSDFKWVAVFTPMWIYDLFFLLLAISLFMDNSHSEQNEDEENHNESMSSKLSLGTKVFNFLEISLFTLIQIFLTMRLDEYIEWDWFLVFIPWFLYEGLQISGVFKTAFIEELHKPAEHDLEANDEEQLMHQIEEDMKYFHAQLNKGAAQTAVVEHLLRVWLAVFIALQVNEDVDWNWGLVLLPIWVFLFYKYIYSYYLTFWGSSKLQNVDTDAVQQGHETDPKKLAEYQQGAALKQSASSMGCSIYIPLFMAIMLVCRLEEDTYSTFLIILPVFIGLGCCFCLVFCTYCCFASIDVSELEEEIKATEPSYAPPEYHHASASDNANSPLQKGNTQPEALILENVSVQLVNNEENNAGTNTTLLAPAAAPANNDVDID